MSDSEESRLALCGPRQETLRFAQGNITRRVKAVRSWRTTGSNAEREAVRSTSAGPGRRVPGRRLPAPGAADRRDYEEGRRS